MKKTTLLSFLWLVAFSLFAGHTYAQVWDSPVRLESPLAGTGGSVGQYAKLLVVNGNPAMVALDATRNNPIYIRATDAGGTTWGAPVTPDSVGNVGQYLSFAIVNGNPAMCYYDSRGILKYVRATDANGSTWGAPVTIATTYAAFTSLVVVNGNPAIAYNEFVSGDLRYVRANDANGATWATPVNIDAPGSVGAYTSMAIVNGNPAISYYDQTNGNLKYVRATNVSGSAWGTPVNIDVTDNIGQYTSMVVVNGNPAIAYYDVTNSNLKYARAADADGATWGTPLNVEAAATDIGQHASLVVVNGNPAIAYHDPLNFRLRYVTATNISGTAWGTPANIDLSANQYASMAIVNGNPAVAFYQGGSALNLKYVRATNVSGSTWASAISIDIARGTGQFTSAAMVNGNPAIAYYDQTNADLKFVRTTDAGGTTWGTPITIDAAGTVGYFPSLAIVNGNPAIAYYDFGLGDLKYVRATNASGTAWGTPQTIDATGITGRYPCLVVVNGNPAIAYNDQTNGDLKYIRATDASGTAWGTALTLDATGSQGIYASMLIVNGNPAIAYCDYGNYDLKYTWATDASGSTWGTPLTIDATGMTGQFNSMAVVNGNPAVAYYDQTNGRLLYVRAANATGSTWGTPQTLDDLSSGVTGWYPSLNIINGNPAISYYDNYNSAVKYLRATNVNGTTWGTMVTVNPVGGENTSMITSGADVFIAYFDNQALPAMVHGTTNAWTGGAGTTTWSTGANWSMGIPPAAGENIGLPAGLSFYPDISSGSVSIQNMSINSGATVRVSGGTLQLKGSITNAGTLDATGGTVIINGTDTQFIKAGTFTATNLELNNTAGATIQSGTINVLDTYTPTAGILTTGGNLVLKSSASGTARVATGSSSGNYISGTVTAERYNPGKRAYRFYAHPFTTSIALSQLTDDIDITGPGGAANGFTPTASSNPSAFWFNVNTADTATTGANAGWTAFTNTDGTGSNAWNRYQLLRLMVRGIKGEGLAGGTYTPTAATFEYAGAINQGTQVITLTKGTNSTFTGCGNPFPAPVQMNTVVKGADIGSSYYAWDAAAGAAGAYVTNPWTLSYKLPAYAAFFTTVTGNTDNTLTFEEADKDTSSNSLFKGTANNYWVELLIKDSTTKWDRLLINFDDSAMVVHDNADAVKLYNPGLDFFTLSQDSARLAVDARPYADSTSIPLGLTAYKRYNKYVISTGLFDIPAYVKLYLHDKYLNTVEEMTPGYEYRFDVTTDSLSQGNKRFEIHMVGKPTTTVAEAVSKQTQMQLIPNPAYNSVKLSYKNLDGTAQVRLTTITGKTVYATQTEGSTGSITIPLQHLPAGIYIAELKGTNKTFTQKLVKQ